MSVNIGIDLGGTKILAAAIDKGGVTVASYHCPTPRDDYDLTLNAIAELISLIEGELNQQLPVGIGMPGSISPHTGLVQNANSVWLNGRAFALDLNARLQRDVRLANDANCFALSEAVDGAAAGAQSVFGVILGTGVGGGIVIDGNLLNGQRSIGGEWGHCALPFPTAMELEAAPLCWCGQKGCMESWISGPALVEQFNAGSVTKTVRVEEIVAIAVQPEPQMKRWANEIFNAHADRIARGLAQVVNLFDPEVIVLGGGLSQLTHLYDQLPGLMAPYIFSDTPVVDIRPPRFGATSGVRGAARLWEYK